MAVQTAVILPREQPEPNLSLSPVSRCAEAGMYEEGKVLFYRAQTAGLGIGRAALQPGLDPMGMEGEPRSDSCHTCLAQTFTPTLLQEPVLEMSQCCHIPQGLLENEDQTPISSRFLSHFSSPLIPAPRAFSWFSEWQSQRSILLLHSDFHGEPCLLAPVN